MRAEKTRRRFATAEAREEARAEAARAARAELAALEGGAILRGQVGIGAPTDPMAPMYATARTTAERVGAAAEGALTELVVQLLLDASKPPPAPVEEPTAAEAAAEAEARAAAVAEAELGMVARRVAVDAKAAAEEAARREAAEAERRAVEAAARAEAEAAARRAAETAAAAAMRRHAAEEAAIKAAEAAKAAADDAAAASRREAEKAAAAAADRAAATEAAMEEAAAKAAAELQAANDEAAAAQAAAYAEAQAVHAKAVAEWEAANAAIQAQNEAATAAAALAASTPRTSLTRDAARALGREMGEAIAERLSGEHATAARTAGGGAHLPSASHHPAPPSTGAPLSRSAPEKGRVTAATEARRSRRPAAPTSADVLAAEPRAGSNLAVTAEGRALQPAWTAAWGEPRWTVNDVPAGDLEDGEVPRVATGVGPGYGGGGGGEAPVTTGSVVHNSSTLSKFDQNAVV